MARRSGQTAVRPWLLLCCLVLLPSCLDAGRTNKQNRQSGNRSKTAGRQIELRRAAGGGFRLGVEVAGRREDFRLERRVENVGLWVAGGGGELRSQGEESVAVYEDTDRGASLLITKAANSSGWEVVGVLGPGRSIGPAAGRAPVRLPGCLPTPPHRVSAGAGPSPGSDYQEVEEGAASSRQGRAAMPATVHPEILVVVDNAFYKDMGRNVGAIKRYLTSYFNAVNMRFATMTRPVVKLNIAGMVVAETARALPFIHTHTSHGDMLDAPSCLHSMGQYYYKSKEQLPVYDIVVAMTGLDMARKKRGRMERATAGFAYVGGACVRNSRLSKISSVALVEDSGAYSGVVVTAHEIGHLLGAVHDGDSPPSYLRTSPGAKACPWRDGYMMSDLRRTSRGLHWSDCSIKQMNNFLRSSTASCLYNKPRKARHPLPGPKSLPGAGLSLNAQCQADRGTNACFHDSRVCSQLFCYYKTGSCYATRPAVEGSHCGSGRHCLEGKCVRKTSSYASHYTTRKPKSIRSTTKVSVAKSQSKKGQVKNSNKSSKLPTQRNTKRTVSATKLSKKSGGATGKSITTSKRTSSNSRRPAESPRLKRHKEISHVVPSQPSDDSGQQCTDSFALMGSLSCDELFKRYSFHYCVRNRTVKKKCCLSYNKYCGAPR